MNIRRITIILLLITACIFAGRAAYRYLGKGDVTINATPTDSTITINNSSYKDTGVSSLILPPGTYPVTVSAPGYKTIKDTIEISWQDSVTKQYKLNLKSFEQIYQETSDPYDITGREVVQEKFFNNNTWAAAYIMPIDDTENPGDVIVVVMQKKQDTWKVVLYSDTLPDDAAQKLPAEVYEYLKPFGESGD